MWAVRPYFHENLSKFYRQTISISEFAFPELNSLMVHQWQNHRGLAKLKIAHKPPTLPKDRTVLSLNQEFQRLDIEDHTKEFE